MKRVRNILEKEENPCHKDMIYLLKKKVKTLMELREYDKVEDLLEEVIERVQKVSGNDDYHLVY